jgi:hypothetical protein
MSTSAATPHPSSPVGSHGDGIAVVRIGRSDGPRTIASTADDGLTGHSYGGRLDVSTPEDGAREATRGRGIRVDFVVGPGSGGAAATTVAPGHPEQQKGKQ